MKFEKKPWFEVPELHPQQRAQLKRSAERSAKKLSQYNELIANEKLMGFPSYRERLAEQADAKVARAEKRKEQDVKRLEAKKEAIKEQEASAPEEKDSSAPKFNIKGVPIN